MRQNLSSTIRRAAPAENTSSAVGADLDTGSVVIPVKLCNLPPLNAIANQVLALSANPEVDLKRLAAVMERDPAFAADVLLLANSALFGVPSRIHVVRDAIVILGIERVRALAVTVAMRGFLGLGGPLIRKCWLHSASCAIVADAIAPRFGITPGQAYSVALLHDIGRLGLLKSYTAECTALLNESYDDSGQMLKAEQAAFRVDHCVAGAWLSKTWGLPRSFRMICEHHHDAIGANDQELLQVVKTACRLADAFGFSAMNYQEVPEYDRIVASLPPNIDARAFPASDVLRGELEARLKSFDMAM